MCTSQEMHPLKSIRTRYLIAQRNFLLDTFDIVVRVKVHTGKPPKWVEKLLYGQRGLSSEEEELEPQERHCKYTKVNEAIDDVGEVEPVENNELVESELVEESEKEPEVSYQQFKEQRCSLYIQTVSQASQKIFMKDTWVKLS